MLPWWENKICILCGRVKNLKIGQNTVTLTDNYIQFGSSATFSAARQLGFDSSNKLIYYDGYSVQTVLTESKQTVKIFGSYIMSQDAVASTSAVTVVDLPVSFDWTNFTRYEVEILSLSPSYPYNLYVVSGSSTATGICKPYFDSTTEGNPLRFVAPSSGSALCYLFQYVLYKYSNVYYIRLKGYRRLGGYSFSELGNNYTYYFTVVGSSLSTSSSVTPDRIKLVLSLSGSGSATFFRSKFVVLGYPE